MERNHDVVGAAGDGIGVRASEVRARAIEFLLEPELPLKLPLGFDAFIGGEPEVAKSLLAVHLAARVSQHRRVVYSTHEDVPVSKVLVPRLKAAGAKLANITFGPVPSFPGGLAGLERQIVAEEAALVVLDTFAKHLDLGLFHPRIDVLVLTPLAEMLARTNAVLIATHHTLTTIPPGSSPQRLFGGGGRGVAGTMRLAFLMARDPEDVDRRLVATAKWSNGERFPSQAFEIEVDRLMLHTTAGTRRRQGVARLVHVGESAVTAEEIVATLRTARQSGRPPEKLAAAIESLVNLLRVKGEMRVAEIYTLLTLDGHTKHTLRRAAETIDVVRTRKEGSTWWSLPAGPLQLDEPEDPDDDDE